MRKIVRGGFLVSEKGAREVKLKLDGQWVGVRVPVGSRIIFLRRKAAVARSV
jgi:hypothetical protein